MADAFPKPEELFKKSKPLTLNPTDNAGATPNLYDEIDANKVAFPSPSVQQRTPEQPKIPGPPANYGSGTNVPLPSSTAAAGKDLFTSSPANAAAAATPNVQSEETVQGQLTDLFSNRGLNPLFERARGSAQQWANSRGLLNSSIAAQAGEEAVMGQAMNIATQDAGTHAQRAAQAQAHLQSMVQAAQQGDINSRLQMEQFGYNFQLSEQENLHNMQLSALQGNIQAALALQQFGFDTEAMRQDFGYRLQLADAELRNALKMAEVEDEDLRGRIMLQHLNTLEELDRRNDIEDDTFRRNLQQNYLTAVERRTLQYSQEVTAIYSTQGLKAEQQAHAVQVARRNFENDMAMLADFYQQSPGWDPNWSVRIPGIASSQSQPAPGGGPRSAPRGPGGAPIRPNTPVLPNAGPRDIWRGTSPEERERELY